jgi:hypothetical protein
MSLREHHEVDPACKIRRAALKRKKENFKRTKSNFSETRHATETTKSARWNETRRSLVEPIASGGRLADRGRA